MAVGIRALSKRLPGLWQAMHARMQTSTRAAQRETAPHAMCGASGKPFLFAAESSPQRKLPEHVEHKSLEAQKPGNQALVQGYLAHKKGFW